MADAKNLMVPGQRLEFLAYRLGVRPPIPHRFHQRQGRTASASASIDFKASITRDISPPEAIALSG